MPDPPFLVAFRTDLRATLNGAPFGSPPTEEERGLVAAHGPAIVSGASHVVDDPRLADVAARLVKGDEAAADIAVGLGRTLLRWRRVLLDEGWRALDAGQPGDAEIAADLVLGSTLGWNKHPENGHAFLLAGRVAKLRNDLGTALQLYQAAVALTSGRDPSGASAAFDNLGLVLAEVGRPDDALDVFAAALAVEVDPSRRSLILGNRGVVLGGLGELRAAARTADEIVDALRASGAEPGHLAIALDNAAVAYLGLGESERARAHLEEARALFGAGGRAVSRMRNAENRSSVLAALGDRDGARDAFVEAYRAAAELWSSLDLDHYTNGFRARAASVHADAFRRLVAELGDQVAAEEAQRSCLDQARHLLQAGLDALHRAEWSESDRLLAESVPFYDRAGFPEGSLMALMNRGTVAMDSGRTDHAIALLLEARATAAASVPLGRRWGRYPISPTSDSAEPRSPQASARSNCSHRHWRSRRRCRRSQTGWG